VWLTGGRRRDISASPPLQDPSFSTARSPLRPHSKIPPPDGEGRADGEADAEGEELAGVGGEELVGRAAGAPPAGAEEAAALQCTSEKE